MFDWPHAPVHRFGDAGVYFITASTYRKQRLFHSSDALNRLQTLLFAHAKEHGCSLQAWALFANHYHLVVSTEAGENLHRMLRHLHSQSAIELNERDSTRGRQVWFQFRDTQLTIEGSWLARLRYTHENAVHHGLVHAAIQYPWCSASWFERTTRQAFVNVVSHMKLDRVKIYDDF